MGKRFEGRLVGESQRIGIVVARFNDFITAKLFEGAMDGLIRHGVAAESVDVAWVPGSFEIPLVAKKLAQTGRYDAVICLGAVIRGETAHFEYVAGEAARGIARASYETGIPVIYQVLSVYDPAQAAARVSDRLNRGREGALAAIEMARLLRRLPT